MICTAVIKIQSTKFCLYCYRSRQRQFVDVGTDDMVIHISTLKRRYLSATFTALPVPFTIITFSDILLASCDNFSVHIGNSWYQNMNSLYPQHVELLFNVGVPFASTDRMHRHERWRKGHFFLWMWKSRGSRSETLFLKNILHKAQNNIVQYL
jgi:hypothetical protein